MLGGVLENGGQDHQRVARQAPDQDRRRIHGEFGPARKEAVDGSVAGGPFEELDIEPFLAEIALLQSRVVPGELELVAPFELQADLR